MNLSDGEKGAILIAFIDKGMPEQEVDRILGRRNLSEVDWRPGNAEKRKCWGSLRVAVTFHFVSKKVIKKQYLPLPQPGGGENDQKESGRARSE
jgi:hypothetical protein